MPRPLAVLLLAVPFAAAQAPEALKNARIEGRVVSVTGEALSKAAMTLSGAGLTNVPAVSTDNEGKFVFENIPAGRYTRLSAQKAGFVTQVYGAGINSPFGTVLNLTPSTDLKDVTIQMTPQGVISGHVSDNDGDPAAGALISVQYYTYAQGRKQLSPDYGGVANDQGDFRVTGLPPGRYYLRAQPRRVATTSQSGAAFQETEVTTFFPNGLDEAGAKLLDLTNGGELHGLDIKLRKERVYSIRGKLVDQTNNSPRGNLSLTLSKLDGKWQLPFFFRARPDGTFEFSNLSPATYLIQSMPGTQTGPDGQPVPSYTVHTEVVITGGSLDVVLPAVAGYEIHGTVTLEGGEVKPLLTSTSSAAGAPTIATSPDGGAFLLGSANTRLSISLASTILNSSSASAAIKEDGTFRFPGLAAGAYLLNIGNVPEGDYVKSVRLGDRDLMRGPLDLPSGGTMSVVLSSKAADVSGIARDTKSNPVSGAIVTVWPKIPDLGIVNGGVKQVNADQSGNFKVTGLAPGEYYAAAWDGLEPGLWQGSEFLTRFNPDASSFKVEESVHASLFPKLMPRERMLAEMDKLP